MKAKTTNRKALAAALVMGAAGAFAGYWLGSRGVQVPIIRASLKVLTGWDLLMLPVLVLSVLAVHEAGHLAGGMSRGMRFLLFIAGPFGWVRTGEAIRFRWFFNLGTLGGLAAAMPVPGRPLLPQLQRLIVGGPLTSLVLALAALAAFWAVPGRFGAYALFIAGFSFLIFLLTAAPFRAGGFMSDGMQFVQLRRDPAMVERRVRLLAVAGLSLAGTRPAELDGALLERAQSLLGDEPVYDVSVCLYSYAKALDLGDVSSAGQWLDRMEGLFDRYPDGFRQSLAVELALFEALYRERAEQASRWLAQATGGVVDSCRRALAQAAVAALQGRRQDALAALASAEASLDKAMDPGFARLGADQIARVRANLEPVAQVRQGCQGDLTGGDSIPILPVKCP